MDGIDEIGISRSYSRRAVEVTPDHLFAFEPDTFGTDDLRHYICIPATLDAASDVFTPTARWGNHYTQPYEASVSKRLVASSDS